MLLLLLLLRGFFSTQIREETARLWFGCLHEYAQDEGRAEEHTWVGRMSRKLQRFTTKMTSSGWIIRAFVYTKFRWINFLRIG